MSSKRSVKQDPPAVALPFERTTRAEYLARSPRRRAKDFLDALIGSHVLARGTDEQYERNIQQFEKIMAVISPGESEDVGPQQHQAVQPA